MRNFVPPHLHLESLDTASTLPAFVAREKELGTGHLTCTDHGSLGACRKVYDLARKNDLVPILGVEGYFRDDNCPVLKAHGVEDVKKYWDGKYAHLTIHCRDQQAYETLCRLISLAPLEKHGSELKPIFDWRAVEELAGQAITLGSGCLGGIVQTHVANHERPDLARAYYERFRGLVGAGNWYVEVFPHRCDRQWDSGIYIRGQRQGQEVREKHPVWRKFRTDQGEFRGQELIRALKKHKVLTVTATMQNRVWVLAEPLVLQEALVQEDFIQNECTPLAPDGDAQLPSNRVVLELAQKHGDPVFVSDDAHFARPEDKIVQDVRLQSGGGSWRMWSNYHRFSSAEAWEYFRTQMGIEEKVFDSWVETSYAWAERFRDFKFVDRRQLPTHFYPKDTLGHTLALIEKHGRMDWQNQALVDRLQEEVSLLHQNGSIDLLPYWFPDEEVCQLYEDHEELTGPGRGSAAGVLLTYLLGVTHVDPLRYGLSLHRFISLDRIKGGKLPDIDQDLPHRDLLVDPEDDSKGWLRERFGDCVAQLSTDTTLKLKSSIKDVFRARQGSVPKDIEATCAKLPSPPQGITDRDWVFGYEGSEGPVPGVIETDAVLQAFVKKYPEEWDIVQKSLGLTRQKGRHACAFVLADEPVYNFIPLTRVGGVRVTQYTAESVEAVGGLKMDFLVVNSLRDIGTALKLIRSRCGRQLEPEYRLAGRRVPRLRILPHGDRLHDIWDLPEDPAVFEDICAGHTETVFQFGTPGAKDWLSHFAHRKPDGRPLLASIEDLAAFTALDRPGPLDAFVQAPDGSVHNQLVEFAHRARGMPAIEALPVLQELLPETHGVLVYQEQLMRVFQVLGGTTAAEADAFRVHTSKKQLAKVLKDREVFMRGAGPRLGEAVAADLWQKMETFANYGFNKSHAVCYVIIGYACAYLKHYFPVEWWTAVLRNAAKDEIGEKFWAHCGNLVDPPDIRLSDREFAVVDGGRIRAPLGLLKGLGDKAQAELDDGTPYADILDFCRKIVARRVAGAKAGKPDPKTGKAKPRWATSALNRGVIYGLIISGTMDSLFPPGGNELDHLQAFEEAMGQALAEAGRPGETQTVDPAFHDLTPLARYQYRRNILPMFSQPLLGLVRAALPKQILERSVAGQPVLVYEDARKRSYLVVTGLALRYLDAGKLPLPPGDNAVAAVGYVLESRTWSWSRDGETKEACELTMDVGGDTVSYIRWPDRNGLPEEFKRSLTGAVVVVVLNKTRAEKPATIESLQVVKPPLRHSSESSPEPK